MKVDVVHILIAILAVLFVCHLIGGCMTCSLMEGMTGATLDYKMGEGVHNSWETRPQKTGPSVQFREQNHDAYRSQFVSPDQGLNFFADTDFAPECCGSSYSANGGLTHNGSTTGGCACMSKKQMDYINQRGGNRTEGVGEF